MALETAEAVASIGKAVASTGKVVAWIAPGISVLPGWSGRPKSIAA
ncbi:hypothetical protein KDK95_24640 [Actinospica sp. MGRD01-02]|uniref:Uncharacterized protein n=1 Tax=Actinospica acidithermotolerans TaxID=2828514 RepID=A0A941EDI1_9ACTN|nr:hypothetical protein [Actinospica acidithermotolerans]MBR7829516.1 hypothetical protein [Actinospica acidithermotolerans]